VLRDVLSIEVFLIKSSKREHETGTWYSQRIGECESHTFGVRAFIMKPVTPKDLSEKVRTVFDTKTFPPA
jgi:hypothetical protein